MADFSLKLFQNIKKMIPSKCVLSMLRRGPDIERKQCADILLNQFERVTDSLCQYKCNKQIKYIV